MYLAPARPLCVDRVRRCAQEMLAMTTDDLEDEELLKRGRRALRELHDAPEVWISRAEAIVTPSLTSRVWRRVVQAVVSFDSLAAPPQAMAVRSAAAGARQLLFTVEGRDIDLRIVPGAAGWTIEGQVLGPDERGEVEIDDGRGAPRTLPLDEFGTFHVDALAAGSHHVALLVGDERIELPVLDVGGTVA
jgi:hypothetical protein